MKLTADTNLLVRVLTEDDERQATTARAALAAVERVAVTLPTLCELSWVLRRGYKHAPARVAGAIRQRLASGTVAVDRAAAEAGLALLDAGGDFADGAIAFEGRRLGADAFISFDARAVERLRARGEAAQLLS